VATCYRHPDRETGLSCSECGRPICTDCVTFAPVGLRCPDHAGTSRTAPRAVKSVQRGVQRPLARRGFVLPTEAIVTRVLVAVNVIIYLITVAQGSGLNDPGGSLFEKWALFGPAVHHGDWWRLITSAFLHGSVLHIVFNMLALWWLGAPVEMALGRVRFLGLYLASGLAGAAGALIANPNSVTVGASGAIFGLLGAGLILEWRATGNIAGNYLILILVNLAISFTPGTNISVGGHIGGLIGGIVCTAIIVARGRFRSVWDTPTMLGLVAVGAASVVIAYLKVRGLA
jgi:membrane associated rhomboid family serine protease